MNVNFPMPLRGLIARRAMAGICVSFMLLAGCQKAPPASAPAPPAAPAKEDPAAEGVALKPEEVEKMGITTRALKATSRSPEAAGFGVVIAHETIAQSVADLATTTAVERQSRSALDRVRRLAGTPGALPVDAQESAVRQTAVDQAALLLSRQRLSATFGQHPPWQHDAQSSVLRSLAGGETKLVRVTFPLGALGGAVPPALRLAHINSGQAGKGWKITALWDAPADASVPGRSLFAVLQGSDASEGERLLAWAPIGAAESGVEIPAAAAVISEGKYWCYVERKPGVFTRSEIDTSMPTDDGYFVKQGVAAGEQVVTASAGLLLARETNPGTAAE